MEWKKVHVFWEEMLAGTAHGKSHLNNEVFNFTDINVSVLPNEIILDDFFFFSSGNPHIVHFWVLEIGAEQKKDQAADCVRESSISIIN